MDRHAYLAARAVQVGEVDAHGGPAGLDEDLDAARVEDVIWTDLQARCNRESREADTTLVLNGARYLPEKRLRGSLGSTVWVQAGQALGLVPNTVALVPALLHLVAVVPSFVLRHVQLLRPVNRQFRLVSYSSFLLMLVGAFLVPTVFYHGLAAPLAPGFVCSILFPAMPFLLLLLHLQLIKLKNNCLSVLLIITDQRL